MSRGSQRNTEGGHTFILIRDGGHEYGNEMRVEAEVGGGSGG